MAFGLLSSRHTSVNHVRIVVSSIGTGEGKTWFSRGLARALSSRDFRVAALKPFETGVTAEASDARSLERASRASKFVFEPPAFFRCSAPVSPHAVAVTGAGADLEAIQQAIEEFETRFDFVLVESAGGLFVPVGSPAAPSVFADLLDGTEVLFLVAANRLGVLSNVLAAVRALPSAVSGAQPIVVLSGAAAEDESSATNARVLRDHSLEVVGWGRVGTDDDDVLAESVEATGLVSRLVAERVC